jgi:hypothetical protein
VRTASTEEVIELNGTEQKLLKSLDDFIARQKEVGRWILEDPRFNGKRWIREFSDAHKALPESLKKVLTLTGGLHGYFCRWMQYYVGKKVVVSKPLDVEVGGEGWKRFTVWLGNEYGIQLQ